MKNVHGALKLIVAHFLLLSSYYVLCIKKDISLHRVQNLFLLWLTPLLSLLSCCLCCDLLQLHEDCVVRINY